MHYTLFRSPLGWLTLVFEDSGLRELRFGRSAPPGVALTTGVGHYAVEQLEEYFTGTRHRFDLQLEIGGTPFQRAVWQELLEIPFGETRSYGEIARAIGRPGAARAVGLANNRNPIPIIVPCHRVIGADGNLTGYAGGLDLKRRLLSLEAENTRESLAPVSIRGLSAPLAGVP